MSSRRTGVVEAKAHGHDIEEEIALERVLKQLQRNVPIVGQERRVSSNFIGSAVLLCVLHMLMSQ